MHVSQATLSYVSLRPATYLNMTLIFFTRTLIASVSGCVEDGRSFCPSVCLSVAVAVSCLPSLPVTRLSVASVRRRCM